MVKRHLYKIVLFFFVLNLNSCKKIEEPTLLSKPMVNLDVQKNTVQVGDVKVDIGPLKDYEQDSDVNFKLTVISGKTLVKFALTTTSDANSSLSKIIATDPVDAIDAKGVFTKQLNSVVVYYSYHIDPLIAPLTQVTLQFTFQNETGYVGSISYPFSVLKKGSSSGILLNTIILSPFAPYYGVNTSGLGIQDNMNPWSGIRGESGTSVAQRNGGFYSLEKRTEFRMVEDCILSAASIDLAGYKTKSAGTAPVLVTNNYYLVSPSDTVILTTTYKGANAAPDVKDIQLRNTVRQMAKTLAVNGKSLRKVYFKRLDNITGTNQVTPAYFDQLTHDNEYDTLLAGIAAEGNTFVGPVALNQVYGFVMDDGRRGLFRTSPPTATDWAGLIQNVPLPTSGNWILYGTIKFQNKK